MGECFHGYAIRLCFQYIWANFTMGIMSGGCVFCPNGDFFHRYDIRLCFLAIWANFTMGMMSGHCVFSPYGEPFLWIWYETVFSGHLGQFYWGNDVRGLCFLSMWGLFPWIWYKNCVFWQFVNFYLGCDESHVFVQIVQMDMASLYSSSLWIWHTRSFLYKCGTWFMVVFSLSVHVRHFYRGYDVKQCSCTICGALLSHPT